MSSIDAFRCQSLWAAVLAHGLVTEISDHVDACDRSDVQWDPAALGRGWIGSRDFRQICNLAGLDAVAVRERVIAASGSADEAWDLLIRLAGGGRRRKHAPSAGKGRVA